MSPATSSTSPTWHIITCEYPPRVGGVSDHTVALAAALSAGSSVHIWCPPTTGDRRALPRVAVHADLKTFGPGELRMLGAALSAAPFPRRIFVQWVPQGFGYRSLNVWFALWLALRGWWHRDHVHLMVHEPFLSEFRQPRQITASLVHRLMLAIASAGASHVWLSTPAWEPVVRRYVPRAVSVGWLPVPVSPAFLDGKDDADGDEQDSAFVVGHFGTYSSLVTPLLTDALDAILEGSSARVILIGQTSDTFLNAFLADRSQHASRIQATGSIAPCEISQRIRTCDVMLQPYPDGVTARRTSTVTPLALGKAIVTNAGRLTEPFWAQSEALELVATNDGRALGEAAVALLANEDRRDRLAASARAFYEKRFDAAALVAMLASPMDMLEVATSLRAGNPAPR